VVTAISGPALPALSFVPATSVERVRLPRSGIFCLGLLELGSQLIEVMRGDHLHERAVACDRYPGRAGVQLLDFPPAVIAEQSGKLARAGGSGSVLVLAHLMLRPAEISSDPPPA